MKIHLRYWDFEIKRCIAVTEKEWELLNIANTMTSDMENSCWKLTMGSDPDLIKCLRGDNHVRQRIANQQWVTQAERDAAHERTVARNAKDKAWRDYARCVWTFGFDNRGNCHDPG
jgi:hypothetical protein